MKWKKQNKKYNIFVNHQKAYIDQDQTKIIKVGTDLS